MSIINNKKELTRVFETHQEKVKDVYKALSIESFASQYNDALSSDEDESMYIELSKAETKSGNSEIIDW